MKQKYKQYTKEEITLLKSLAGRKTTAEIAIIMGRTEGNIRYRASKEGICLRIWGGRHHKAVLNEMQTEMIKVLHDAGYTANEIHKCCFIGQVTAPCIYHVVNERRRLRA